MNKDDLIEMIRSEIRSLAFETLRNNSKKKKDNDKSRIFKPKGLSEEDVEYSIFHGGNKPDKKRSGMPITIKEQYDNGLPTLQKSEIVAFEDGFEEMLKEIDGASVVFDIQSNGESFKAWMGKDGIEAGASGTIDMGDRGKMIWSYSLKNGIHITTEDLRVEQGNKRLMEKVYNHYDAWQKEWREKLTIQPGKEEMEIDMEMPAEEIPTPEGGTGVATPAPTAP